MSKTKYKKQNKKITQKINNETKVVVGAYLSRKKRQVMYDTYRELLSKKYIDKRFRFLA